MSQADIDIIINKGQNYNPIYTFKDGDGNAITITGATINFTLYDEKEGTALFTKVTPTQIEINADQVTYKGQFTVHILPSDTSGLDGSKTYWYKIDLTLSSDTRIWGDWFKLKKV